MNRKASKNVCPATALLAVLGKRHILLILYTLTGGALGFNALQEKLGINTATLSRRLQDLESEKLVERTSCATDSRCHYYILTKRGEKISRLLGEF